MTKKTSIILSIFWVFLICVIGITQLNKLTLEKDITVIGTMIGYDVSQTDITAYIDIGNEIILIKTSALDEKDMSCTSFNHEVILQTYSCLIAFLCKPTVICK